MALPEERVGLIFSEVQNPAYVALLDHVKLEIEWSLSEKDLYSFCWGLLALPKLRKEDISSIKALLEDEVAKFEKTKDTRLFLRTDYILGLCLATRILTSQKKGLPTDLKTILEELLEQSEKRDWLKNHEFASIVLVSLAGIDVFSSRVDKVAEWLKLRYEFFKKEQNKENLIDCIFGLVHYDQNFSVERNFLENCIEKISEISDERLAKLLLILQQKQYGDNEVIKVVDEVEARLKKEFKDQLNPILERGLREIINLLHSSCPPEVVKKILESLKEEGIAWASDLKNEGKSIVIEKLPQLTYLPKIEPKTHSLMLKALRDTDRVVLYQLNKREFKKAENAVKQTKTGFWAIRQLELIYILVYSGVLGLMTYMLLLRLPWINWNELVFFLSSIYLNPLALLSYALRFGWPYLVLVIAWIIYLRSLNVLKIHGVIKKENVIDLIPGMRRLANLFFGLKSQNGESNE
jgi:hypothetical protein